MAIGAFCGVAPFFFRKKFFRFQKKSLSKLKKVVSQPKKPLSESRNSSSMDIKSSEFHSSYGVATKTELKHKISSFRGSLDLSPSVGSASLNELIKLTLNDLFKLYPCINRDFSVSDIEDVTVRKALKLLCVALKSLNDLWAKEEWMIKCNYDPSIELEPNDLEQRALKMLDDMIKLAREQRFDSMGKDEVMKQSTRGMTTFEEALSDSYSDKLSIPSSPETPTSILPEAWRASSQIKKTPSLPMLLPARVLVIRKLNPIDVKYLSLDMFSHAVTQDPRYLQQFCESEKEDKECERRASDTNEVNQGLDIAEKIDDVDSKDCSMKVDTTKETLMKFSPPPPPPQTPFPPNSLTLPPMISAPTTPPSNMISPKIVSSPPPSPPRMESMNGAPPLRLSVISSKIVSAPPPPPPLEGIAPRNGAQLPIPASTGASEIVVASSPPMAKGAIPPPPPVLGSAKNLHLMKSTSKLKRSSQMGNLYRLLKGKVEGSSLDVKTSGRKGRVGAASDGKQGMADALAEMTKRSAYFQQIEEDVNTHAESIKEVKNAISYFQTSDMGELLKFYNYLESHLEKLTDETQVLARFEEFPTKKLEALRMAAAQYSKLDSIASTLQNWPIVSPVRQLLDKVESYFNKIKGEIDTLERTKDEEAKKFQGHEINFDFGILVRIKESMVDLSSSCMELALKEKRDASAQENNEFKCARRNNRPEKILWRSFQFAFRVYSFAGGHDDRADKLTRELADEIETDPLH